VPHYSYEGPNTAQSRASLLDGSVRAAVTAASSGEAYAQWFERVTFSLPTGVSSADVDVLWNVDGINGQYSVYPNGNLVSQFSVSGTFRIFAFQNGHDSVDLSFSHCSYGLCGLGSVSHIFTDTFRVDANTLYEIDMGIYVFGQQATLDFSHTAFLSFVLPQGVTMNSSSGVLLAQPIQVSPTAVPEPTTWAMMLVGFGIVAAGMRRKYPDQQRSLAISR